MNPYLSFSQSFNITLTLYFLSKGASSRGRPHAGGSGVIEEDTKPPIDLNNLAHNPVVYPSEDGQHISTLPGGK